MIDDTRISSTERITMATTAAEEDAAAAAAASAEPTTAAAEAEAEAEERNGSSCKRSRTDAPLSDVVSPDVLGLDESELNRVYADAKPYPHCLIENMFLPDFLKQVQKEIKDNSKVNFKESDLFTVYQSIDFANLTEEQHGKSVSFIIPCFAASRTHRQNGY